MLSKQEIIDQLYSKTKNRIVSRIVQLINQGNRPELLEALVYHTSYLPTDSNISQRMWHLVNNQQSIPLCLHCNTNITKFIRFNIGYTPYCCHKCSSSSTIKQQKYEQTCQTRYGVTNSGLSEHSKEKRKNTNIDKYGVEYPLQNSNILTKTHTTQQELYDGVGFNSDIIRAESDKIKLELYGTTHSNPQSHEHVTDEQRLLLANKELLLKYHHIDKLTCLEIADIIGLSRTTILKALEHHNIDVIYHHSSSQERKITNWLDSINIDYQKNDRHLIKPLELDIIIPKHNVAIEVNGLWYHSDRNGQDKHKHLLKTNQCKEQGYRLLHFYDYELNVHEEKCKSIIFSALQQSNIIYARKTSVIMIPSNIQRTFFNDNHIQGYSSSSICYGLMYNNELVACMSFGHSRYSKQYDYELIRYASKLHNNVIGGASKLFKHFIHNHNPESIISYCDNRLFTGIMYQQLDFQLTHISNPCAWYFDAKQDRLYHRTMFQKHKLSSKLTTYDPNISSWNNIVNNGYNRIWDCGHYVFNWRKNNC